MSNFRDNCRTTKILRSNLLLGLYNAVELWFRLDSQIEEHQDDGAPENSLYEQIRTTCVEILLHGLENNENVPNKENVSFAVADGSSTDNAIEATNQSFRKLVEDFEWVRSSVQLRDNSLTSASSIASSSFAASSPPPLSSGLQSSVSRNNSAEQFLHSWTLRNLKSNCLCACVHALVADKELLEGYYSEGAFLRNENFSTAFFICLTALELNQRSLLSQIEVSLYSSKTSAIEGQHRQHVRAKHKRSSSHPNFSISPPKKSIALPPQPSSEVDGRRKIPLATLALQPSVFPTFRKVKSLPHIMQNIPEESPTTSSSKSRPRSKTMTSATQPKDIPKVTFFLDPFLQPLPSSLSATTSSNTSSSYGDDYLNLQPSTSASSSKKSQLSRFSTNSNSSATSISSSSNSTTTARRIELIKCDDIKIWTDQTYELRQQQQETATELQAIPKSTTLAIKSTKNMSPINSFLSSLFSTPPTYSRWSPTHIENGSAYVDDSSCLSQPHLDASGGGVFDAFLPVYGRKLRSRKSQNLFEDGISTLDYSSVASCLDSNTTVESAESSSSSQTGGSMPKHSQSLTAFLQMAQLSRNSTELEKENAHFRISEAIISAIEHIKWAKLEPDKWRRDTETSTATDWLESEQQLPPHISCLKTEHKTGSKSTNSHHIPVVCESFDLPSAEVVGLALISKINDRHLPKVSELKWLVSEEDTPQKLLPMPDDSPSANPDDNVIPSITRGTRYWAPPRQQIIFTDHPQPNRKQLIQKQNNRCAGCGMRVSPQYLHSFRYCTYLGKYHCTGCHRNQISATPAKILQMWDFKCYPVSVFSYRLLEQMYTYPLFYVPDLNPALYVKNKVLVAARTKRIHLKFVRDFIKACRFADQLGSYFDSIPNYITSDPDTWSMSDFIDTRNKSLQRSIDELIEKSEEHIFNCVLCTQRGFICEYCHKDQVIFPWGNKTYRCDACGSCFHLNCWKSMLEICCRCQRIKKRQVDLLADI